MREIIVIEGAPCVGSTTVANLVNKRLPQSAIYSNPAIEDKSATGKQRIFRYYKRLHAHISSSWNTGFDFILDRTFFTEFACRKIDSTRKGDFDKQFLMLLEDFIDITDCRYKVKSVLLLASKNTFTQRMIDSGYWPENKDINFLVENSIKQQEIYLNIWKELDPVLRPIVINTDDISAEDIVDQILNCGHN